MRMNSTVFFKTNLSQEFQNIPFLLAQGQDFGQDTRNKKAAMFTPDAKTVVSPQDTVPKRAFGGMISRFDALMVNKRAG